jgi:hypothetical protein
MLKMSSVSTPNENTFIGLSVACAHVLRPTLPSSLPHCKHQSSKSLKVWDLQLMPPPLPFLPWSLSTHT